MAQKLSDADVAKIRRQAEDRPRAEIARDFGVSRRHIGRIIRGEQRQQLGGLDRGRAKGSTVAAVEHFLADLELATAEVVMAETARSLAAKLDQARDAESAASATALPQLAYRLIEIVAELRGDEQEPDAVEELRRKREARQLAVAHAAAAERQR